ncbi:MAG: DNA cytosine methyltransferase [Ignavibacteriales bacterium]|nr:DNA cytosine methyltransferase [Ignavibacteriales bacterium]
MNSIPIIDLFAGPGGLGEGFSSVRDQKGKKIFDIRLSIEKDEHAHKTLRLRSFYRQFEDGKIPELYYQYIKENNKKKQESLLRKIKEKYKKEWENAEREAWHFELPYPEEYNKKGEKKGGYTEEEIIERHKEIDLRIQEALPANNEFILIGGPPCQAYSLVGRARNQGISAQDHRVHLYKEYLRIIAKHHPAVFVMENVKGLLSANVDGLKVFDLIKADLKEPEKVYPGLNSPRYKVFSFIKEPNYFDEENFPVYTNDKDYLIRTEKYNIPQRRHRVILLGIREDITFKNYSVLKKNTKETPLYQVIDNLPKIRSGIGRKVTGTNIKGNHIYKTIRNDYTNWIDAVNEYKEQLDSVLRNELKNFIKTDQTGVNYIKADLEEENNPLYESWYKDDQLNGVLNHESRTHLKEDLGRYLFSSLYLKAKGEFPRLKDYPEALQPAHKNRKTGKFADRFRTQKPDQPATTITSHISKDGHYFIHYDSSQCRSLSVREAARIQTFPDNYYFCGSRTHQYHQVGNAVPPYLAKQIAEIVKDIFKKKNNVL